MCTNWKEGGNCVQFGVKSEQVLLDERGGTCSLSYMGNFHAKHCQKSLQLYVIILCHHCVSRVSMIR